MVSSIHLSLFEKVGGCKFVNLLVNNFFGLQMLCKCALGGFADPIFFCDLDLKLLQVLKNIAYNVLIQTDLK